MPSDLPIIGESVDRIARPDTVKVTVLGASEVPISKTFTIWAKGLPGLAAEDVRAAVESALVASVKGYPIGGIAKPPSLSGYLYADFLKGTAKAAHAAIFDVDALDTDVFLAAGQVAVITAVVDVRLVAVRN